jgi:hypothetical protein
MNLSEAKLVTHETFTRALIDHFMVAGGDAKVMEITENDVEEVENFRRELCEPTWIYNKTPPFVLNGPDFGEIKVREGVVEHAEVKEWIGSSFQELFEENQQLFIRSESNNTAAFAVASTSR